MKSISVVAILASFFLTSCNQDPTLQKYFVENTDDKNFISLDISPKILKVDKTKLSAKQSEALQSFDKMNILAFKLNDSNRSQFETQRAKVEKILKDEKYQQLIKFGSGKEGASVSFVGDDEHIDEFVLFANNKENGFAVIRILGDDMNPTGIMTMMSVLQNANVDLEQLKPLQQMFETNYK